jgi:hypothetical protein
MNSFTNIQNEEFKKAYDSVLREKKGMAIVIQNLELDN